ncbi:Mannose-6-phosphate isomerase [Orbilia blumenaviensis]|uniref:Mannose-6-phosphate isomerase n=1 Tax=Orbilia blumenaviensis TaxID=1796055 RepID=A0AAV9VQ91_9PEZI
MVLPVPLYELRCGVNNYDWGKPGSTSRAAQFAAAASIDLTINESKPYAELWMGTHPTLPSTDVASGRSLRDLVSTNESLLGPAVVGKFGSGTLPFLFKVLSIGKALSIQAHPDKRLAEQLHADDPKNYPDDNHKPEMAIAITPFTGLCGFRPLPEIDQFLSTVPALRDLLGSEAIDAFRSSLASEDEADRKRGLRDLYAGLMTSDSTAIASSAESLVGAAKSQPDTFAGGARLSNGDSFSDLIIELNNQFPSDIGLFSTFFLNFVSLSPGQAMFLQANEPHAYISGDIIECMAASDNVVRAGFTPKFKDVKTLINMLTYRSAPVSAQIMTPTQYPFGILSPDTKSESLLYDPPIEEFAVVRTTLESGSVEFQGILGPSIIIFTAGSGEVRGGGGVGKEVVSIRPGTVVFVGAGLYIQVEGTGIECYRAFCSVEQNVD